MFKVICRFPINSITEVYLSEQELNVWLTRAFLRARIISYERIS